MALIKNTRVWRYPTHVGLDTANQTLLLPLSNCTWAWEMHNFHVVFAAPVALTIHNSMVLYYTTSRGAVYARLHNASSSASVVYYYWQCARVRIPPSGTTGTTWKHFIHLCTKSNLIQLRAVCGCIEPYVGWILPHACVFNYSHTCVAVCTAMNLKFMLGRMSQVHPNSISGWKMPKKWFFLFLYVVPIIIPQQMTPYLMQTI